MTFEIQNANYCNFSERYLRILLFTSYVDFRLDFLFRTLEIESSGVAEANV